MSDVAAETGEASLRRAIRDSNQDPIPRNIVLRVCLGARGSDALLQRLYREMEIFAPLLARDRQIVHFTLEGDGLAQLDATQHADLLQSLEQHFALARTVMAPAEQCGNPPVTVVPADCDVLGLGLGAVSHFGGCQSANAADLQTYSSALDAGRLPIVGCHWDDPAP
jgi:coproporphyrinogen III oxidase-like Fe-S oxidoreductase